MYLIRNGKNVRVKTQQPKQNNTLLENKVRRIVRKILKEEESYSIAAIVDKKYSKIVTAILEKILGWDGFNEVDRMDYIHYELTQSDFNKVKPKIEKYIEETEEV